MTQQLWIALLAVVGVCAHLIMRFAIPLPAYEQWPLWLVLGLGVLILGTVAMALLRHLGGTDAKNPTAGSQ